MKNLFILLAATATLTMAASCSKCVTCTKGDAKSKLCDKDWNADDQGDQIEFYENLGWECKRTSATY